MKEHFSINNCKVFYKKTELKKISAEQFLVFFELGGLYKTYVDRAFLKNKDGIWWFHEGNSKPKVTFLTADFEHFTVINEDYCKDGNQVFWMRTQCVEIPNSDADSFQVLTETPYFEKDKNQVYALSSSAEGLQIFEHVDSITFGGLGWNSYATDKDNVYHFNWHFMELNNRAKYAYCLDDAQVRQNNTLNQIYEINKKYVKQLYPNINGWWQDNYDKLNRIDSSEVGHFGMGGSIYYIEKDRHSDGSTPNLVNEAETTSFKSLDTWYGKDKNRVYFKWKQVLEADVTTFVTLRFKLAKDHHHYYYNGFKITNIDYDSFQPLEKHSDEYQLIAKDKNSIFSSKNKRLGKFKGYADLLIAIKNSDPESLEIYSEARARDKNQVYWHMQPNLKIDVASFKHLFYESVNDWAKDKHYLYNANGRRKVKGVDGASFKMLNKYWGKDNRSVFSFLTERILPSIDVETFRVLDPDGTAEDKNYRFKINHGVILKSKR